jgi:hypothetical protein
MGGGHSNSGKTIRIEWGRFVKVGGKVPPICGRPTGREGGQAVFGTNRDEGTNRRGTEDRGRMGDGPTSYLLPEAR